MHRIALFIILILIIPIHAISQYSGTYFVDQNDSISPRTFQSIQEASDSLSLYGISSSVNVKVVAASGPYYEQVVFLDIPGSSSTNTVEFDGQGERVIGMANPTMTNVMQLFGCDHFTLNNFYIILEDSLNYGAGLIFSDSTYYCTVTNCRIEASTTTTSTNSACILGSPVSGALWNTVFEHNTIEDNELIGGYSGIAFKGSKGKYNVIRNNVIRDFTLAGVYIYSVVGTIIDGNDISREGRTDVGEFHGIYLTWSNPGTVIKGNSIHNSHDNAYDQNNGPAYGIYTDDSDAPSSNPCYIYNNIIYHLNSTNNVYGIYSIDSDYWNIYHNTVIFEDYNASAVAHAAIHLSGDMCEVKNNLVYNDRFNGNAPKYCISVPFSGPFTNDVDCDFNNLYSDNPTVLAGNRRYYGPGPGSGNLTLAQWVYDSGQDSNSISADPVFVDRPGNNYTPTDSLANNSGLPISIVNEDFYGNLRSSTNPDAGAIEFEPLMRDAGIESVNLTQLRCPGTAPLNLVVENKGYLSLDSVWVVISIDGNIVDTVNLLVNVSRNDTQSVYVDSITYLSGSILKIWTINPNLSIDQFPGNDTITVEVASGMYGLYTIDQGSPEVGRNYQSFTSFQKDVRKYGVCDSVVASVKTGSGPYTEQLVLDDVVGASSVNTITYLGNGESLNFNPTYDSNSVIRFRDADYYRIRNLTINMGTSSAGKSAISFENHSDHNIIDSCYIYPKPNKIAIQMIDTNYLDAVPGQNDSNIIRRNFIGPCQKAVEIFGQPGGGESGYNQFINNQIEGFTTHGIRLVSCYATIISGNDFSRTNAYSSGNANKTISLENTVETMVSKNRIHDLSVGTGRPNVEVFFMSGIVPSGKENIFSNNLIYNNEKIGDLSVFFSNISGNFKVLNNTIYFEDATNLTSCDAAVLRTDAAISNVDFINNNIYIKSDCFSRFIFHLNSSISNFDSDHNNLFINLVKNDSYKSIARIANNAFTDFPTWQSAEGGKYDSNSVITDPLFLDKASGSYVPYSFALNNRGRSLIQVSDDILDSARGIKPDIGAYEFSVGGVDIAVMDLSLDEVVCPGMNPVSVNIHNYSDQNINNVQIKVEIDGMLIDSTIVPSILQDSSLTIHFDSVNIISNSNFKVYTVLLNDSDAYSFNDTISKNVLTRLKGNHYILDATSPASDTNLGSINTLRNILSTRGVCGPVVINVVPTSGPLTSIYTLLDIKNVSAVNNVTIKGNGVVVQPNSTNSNYPAMLTLSGTQYLTLDSFNFYLPSNSSTSWALRLSKGADHNVIRNCVFDHGTYSQGTGDHVGIIVADSTLLTGGGQASHNLIEKNHFVGGDQGIALFSNGNALINNRIEENVFEKTGRYGIQAFKSDSLIIEGNDISRSTSVSQDFTGIELSGYCARARITENRIHDINGGGSGWLTGIHANQSNGNNGANGYEVIVANNVLYDFNGVQKKRGFMNQGSNNIYYVHNSLVLDQGLSSSNDLIAFDVSSSSPKTRFMNNIVSLTNGGSGKAYGLKINYAVGIQLETDYNNIEINVSGNGDGYVGHYIGTDYSDMPAWIGISSLNYDHHSYDENSFMERIGDNFYPRNAVLDSMCPVSAGILTDILDSSRSLPKVDPGAFEFLPYGVNIGAIEVIDDDFTKCEDSLQALSAVFKNYGSIDQAAVPVFLVIKKGSTITTLTDTLYNLASRSADTAQFGDLITYYGGTYNFRAYSSLSGDLYLANDTSDDVTYQFYYKPENFALNDTVVCQDKSFYIALPHDSLADHYWFLAASGGSAINVGDTLTSSGLSGTTDYFIEKRTLSTCRSDRVKMEVSTQTMSAAMQINQLSNDQYEFTYSSQGVIFDQDWDFGDSQSLSDSTAIHSYGADGIYNITLTVYGLCDTLTLTDTLNVKYVGIQESGAYSWSLYPNPTKERFIIQMDKEYSQIKVIIYNELGQIKSEENFENVDQLELKLSGADGLNFVEVRVQEGPTKRFKVVKRM